MTLNIIANYHLIEAINSFIKANKNNKGKYKDSDINNKFKKAEEESFYMFNHFGNEDFNKFYFKLIINFQQGNIRAFHKFIEIRERYKYLQKYKKEIFSFEQNYIIILTLSINAFLDDLFLFSNLKEFREFPLIHLNLKRKINQLQNLQNQLELDLDLLKKFVVSVDYRVNYELRRKIGNLLADKILNIFGEKIDKIELTLYLISLSIEDIEKKIVNANNTIIDEKYKVIVLKQLKEKYQRALDLLKEVTSNKLKNIRNLKQVKWPQQNISYTFTGKVLNQKEIHENTIINLFFIIKKKLSETFNDSIHNKTMKLNYLAKKELEKFIIKNEIKSNEEKSKITESQELLIKTNSFDEGDNKNQNVIEIKHENLVKVKEDILCQKEGENEKSRFAKNCKKRNILSIKQKIRIAQSKFETNINILVENNTLNGISFLYDFYNNLKKKENQIFDITSNLSSKSAINLYFTGEKNEVMIPLNKNKYKKSEENEDKKRMKLILEDSYKSQNVDEIKDDLKNINLLIENNINSLQHFQKKSFDFIEDYGEFFNIEKIIKEIGLTIPLNISDIYNRIKEIESISIKTDLYEKCFYICHIYAFLYFEEFIDYYK